MNIIIAEDEKAARDNLVAILREACPECNITGSFESVQDLIEWVRVNPVPDLAFFDIQLSDQNVFKLFTLADIKFPVVFVTAFDHYALKAFKVNSIDYILKPVHAPDIKFAIEKYKEMMTLGSEHMNKRVLAMVEKVSKIKDSSFKKTFLAEYKDKMIPLTVSDIAAFYIDHGVVFALTNDNNQYLINDKLETIEKQLDPEMFFRANRQFIISREAVKEINPYFGERLLVKLSPRAPEKVFISKAKATTFKKWMSQ